MVLETVLLCSPQPLRVSQLVKILSAAEVVHNNENIDSNIDQTIDHDCIQQSLMELNKNWQGKGLTLCETASGWRFQSIAPMQPFLQRITEERPLRYSRAVIETLTIIAYRQPVTRGDIEDIRGVAVNSQIIRQLEDRGWIEAVGSRDVPGRPTIFATTKQFLDDLGLKSINDLPPLANMSQIETETNIQAENFELINQQTVDNPTSSTLSQFKTFIETNQNEVAALTQLPEMCPIINDMRINPNLNQCEVSGTVDQSLASASLNALSPEKLPREISPVLISNQATGLNATNNIINPEINQFPDLKKEGVLKS